MADSLSMALTELHAAGFDPQVDDSSTGSTTWNNIAGGHGVALVVASAAPQVPRGIALGRLGSPPVSMILDALWRRDNELPVVRHLLETTQRVSAEHHWL